jgi:hypothetical protein
VQTSTAQLLLCIAAAGEADADATAGKEKARSVGRRSAERARCEVPGVLLQDAMAGAGEGEALPPAGNERGSRTRRESSPPVGKCGTELRAARELWALGGFIYGPIVSGRENEKGREECRAGCQQVVARVELPMRDE